VSRLALRAVSDQGRDPGNAIHSALAAGWIGAQASADGAPALDAKAALLSSLYADPRLRNMIGDVDHPATAAALDDLKGLLAVARQDRRVELWKLAPHVDGSGTVNRIADAPLDAPASATRT
jgi:hypothetical protein